LIHYSIHPCKAQGYAKRRILQDTAKPDESAASARLPSPSYLSFFMVFYSALSHVDYPYAFCGCADIRGTITRASSITDSFQFFIHSSSFFPALSCAGVFLSEKHPGFFCFFVCISPLCSSPLR